MTTPAMPISCPPDTPIWMRAEITSGVYEQIEQEWCAELPGGDLALELGAGIGMVTRVLQQRYRRIVAVEANAELSPYWSHNVMPAPVLGGETSISLVHGMIGGDVLHVPRAEFWKATGSRELTTAVSDRVDMAAPRLALGDLVEMYDPDVIVCDIEGAEAEALRDAANMMEMLGRVRDVIVELHPGLWSFDVRVQAILDKQLRVAMSYAGFTNVRECRAEGWPPGSPHPLGISHIWWQRTRATHD